MSIRLVFPQSGQAILVTIPVSGYQVLRAASVPLSTNAQTGRVQMRLLRTVDTRAVLGLYEAPTGLSGGDPGVS